MLRFTLRQLEYFVAVGETGSIASASKRVNVSSPSISSAISSLEEELGLSLFVREHAHGLYLTTAGREIFEQAKIVLAQSNRISDIAGDIAGSIRGPLSVGCLTTFAQFVLPRMRKNFENSFPEVRVSQHILNQAEIISQLRKSEIDIALTYDLDLPADLNFTQLLKLPPYALVDPEHELAGHEELSIENLKDYPMVLLDLPHSSEYFLSLFLEQGFKPNIVEKTRDMAVMRSLVANGYGFSIANVRPLTNFAPDGKELVFLPISGDLRPMRMGFLVAQDVQRSNTVKTFIDHCEKFLDEIDVLIGAGKL